MPIAIILRNRYNVNRFRDLMIQVIRSRGGDNVLLCSGFFQENFRSDYQASQELAFANVLAQANIDLITVGIHNNTWLPSYRKFKQNLLAAGVNLDAKYKYGLKWHAKVFILSRGSLPVFGIIGSSNITRNAFSLSKPFNYECDTILWLDGDQHIEGIVNEFLAADDFDEYEVIRASYQIELNRNLSIADRLNRLKSEILESGLRDLD
ncbi:phospholipase D family protein [Chloroflexota bacterium]